MSDSCVTENIRLLGKKILSQQVPLLPELTIEENRQVLHQVVDILNKNYAPQMRDAIFEQWNAVYSPPDAREVPKTPKAPIKIPEEVKKVLDAKLLQEDQEHRLVMLENGEIRCSCEKPSCFWNETKSKPKTIPNLNYSTGKPRETFWGL